MLVNSENTEKNFKYWNNFNAILMRILSAHVILVVHQTMKIRGECCRQ